MIEIARRSLMLVLGPVAFVALVTAWMRYTRIGAGFANDVVNPVLIARGLSGSRGSELATLEHIGRRTGTRRLTPLHAIPTPDGIRFAVPLGARSEWARNVLAAGECRMQYHGRLVDLDEPRLLDPTDVPGMSQLAGRLTTWLGWRYLTLRRVREQAGGSLVPDPVVSRDVDACRAEGPAPPSAAVTAPGQDRPVSRAARLALRWTRTAESSPGYARYRRATRRPVPVLRLVPTEDGEGSRA